ncbi:MAG TPA: hypothetical protein VKT52_05940 [Ktedonobacterales bacterium]|nr:hypothetical protein [Ktedonobacterales bacterium]
MVNLAPQPSMPRRAIASDRQPPVGNSRPHPWEMVIHPVTTIRFMAALARDPRISRVRKLLYVGPMMVLLVALLLPESIVAVGVAVFLPLIGPLVNVPADAALDWFVFGLAAYALLGILPQGIVREHHAWLFHPTRKARR